MRVTALLTPLVLLVAAGATTAGEDNPCRAEVERLCPGVQPGEGRLHDCARRHLPKLSAGCRQRVEHARRALSRENGPRMVLACKQDIETLCGDVPPGEGRWRRCLGDNATRLSAPCRQLLDLARSP
jgi:hypothetical protein